MVLSNNFAMATFIIIDTAITIATIAGNSGTTCTLNETVSSIPAEPELSVIEVTATITSAGPVPS